VPRFDPVRALRAPLRGMTPYAPVEPPAEMAARYGVPADRLVKLDANENPYGPSPRAVDALRGGFDAHRYPDPGQRRVREALAQRHSVPAECIVAGAGSDELIDLLFRTYVEPGDRIVICSPTFGMYAFDAGLLGAEVVDVPLRDDWSIDADALVAEASRAKAVFIPTPNNPTGGLLPLDLAERLIETGALLVVDEAYIEFSHGESLVGRAADGAPLVVLRTFSKWGGLAGLRVGYGVMPRAIADTLMQVKQPYGVNVAAEVAVLASLEDRALLDERACAITGERERMAQALRDTGWLDPAPSEANFLLVRMVGEGLDATAVREALRRHGIFVRTFDHPRLRHHIRISVGMPEDTDRVLTALREVGQELRAGNEATR
jgi:histidinol-phosphate aminotransferase